ncbi:MAG TPA: sugar phosphate isomerase/epimerase [Mycobacteriales bacterium]|nr:sugar phosphate isomerase/epimerase [Mycobacteriales bacterium]
MNENLGIFSEAFLRPDPADAASALAAAGFGVTQLNWPSLGLDELPDPANPPDYEGIRTAYDGAGVRICAVSGTYNMIHADPDVRRAGTQQCLGVIAGAPRLGTDVVTLCTGTRTVESMWRAHPDNTSAQAWADLRATFDELLPAAEAAGVRLGVEPEPSNVIRDTEQAVRLVNELGTDARHIAVVLDPANLLNPAALSEQESDLTRGFRELGERACAVHAKDLTTDGRFGPPGTGILDYDLVHRLYDELPVIVPVVIQDTIESDVPRVREFLRSHSIG